MHGIIFSELRKYAETKRGSGTWNALLKQANLGNKVYLPLEEYPDAEVVALVSATVLEDFGEFIAPALMKMYGHLMRPEWKALDVIDNTARNRPHRSSREKSGCQAAQLKDRSPPFAAARMK